LLELRPSLKLTSRRIQTTFLLSAVSIAMGVIPVVDPNFFHFFPNWSQTIVHSGITLGSLTAIILNAFF
ncbi:MAG TPA: hypothetical protein VIM32_03020, partial [Desulfosporosinus sp.]